MTRTYYLSGRTTPDVGAVVDKYMALTGSKKSDAVDTLVRLALFGPEELGEQAPLILLAIERAIEARNGVDT